VGYVAPDPLLLKLRWIVANGKEFDDKVK